MIMRVWARMLPPSGETNAYIPKATQFSNGFVLIRWTLAQRNIVSIPWVALNYI